ncbi:S49 family peptidase [Caldichromatium japonicum]|uniref:S49 family peptidase n=1 Tax=Caldichromatium japonicum TaxID=2699430 RepID=UPI003CCDF863
MDWKPVKTKDTPLPDPSHPEWERALINRLVLEYLADQRRRQRWSLILKLGVLLYLIGLLIVASLPAVTDLTKINEEHTALIEVNGILAPEADASAERIIAALRAAFENKHVKGIILAINSPGGSPVQAGMIYDEIKRLKEKYQKDKGRDLPVYAVAIDLCASGGYYVAAAADAIYVNPASLVGSIGVRLSSFGFQKAMEELGIERRLLTAGTNKGILDPFSPLPEPQRAFLQRVLERLHQQFIAAVKAGRGERLKGGDELFSGLFWSGDQAVELGLADGLGSASQVAREQIGAEKIVEYSKKRDLLDALTRRFGAMMTLGFIEALGLGGEGLARY